MNLKTSTQVSGCSGLSDIRKETSLTYNLDSMKTPPSFTYYSQTGLKQFLVSICWQFGCKLVSFPSGISSLSFAFLPQSITWPWNWQLIFWDLWEYLSPDSVVSVFHWFLVCYPGCTFCFNYVTAANIYNFFFSKTDWFRDFMKRILCYFGYVLTIPQNGLIMSGHVIFCSLGYSRG